MVPNAGEPAGVIRRLFWRLAPSLVGAAVYLAFATVRRFNAPLYQKLLAAFDSLPTLGTFSDMASVLNAVSCAHRGVDVYVRNSCMHGGQYNYSGFLLHIGELFRLNPAQTTSAGLLSGGLVLTALTLLPAAQSGGEVLLRVAATCSSALVVALESANVDSLIFVAALCAVLALRHGTPGRAFGYGMFGLLAAIKFYPAILLLLLVREERCLVWLACWLGLTLALLYGWYYGGSFIAAMQILPAAPPFSYMFGARNIVAGLAVLFGGPHSPFVTPLTVFLVALALFAAWREGRHYVEAVLGIDETKRLLLLSGAMIVVESFFLTQNGDYRGLFLLFTLPGLFAMARAVPSRAGTFQGISLAVLFLMWEPLARYLTAVLGGAVFGGNGVWLRMAFWLVREFVWWRVCIFMAALVIAWFGTRLPVLLPARRAG